MGGPDVDVVIHEIGGTVGDIESQPFLESARQVRHEIGRDHVFFLHVSLVPYIGPSGELKTKPTQHSVAALRSIGIQPDAIVCRSDRAIPTEHQAQDLADVRRRGGGGRHRERRAVDLRHPQGAAQRGPRRLRRAPPRPAVPRRRLDAVGRAAAPRARPGRRGHHRAGRQVRRPARRLPVGRPRRCAPAASRTTPRSTCAGCRPTSARPRPAPPSTSATSTASACPAASASAASRASSARSRTPASRKHPGARACASACSAWSSSSPGTSPASRAPAPRSSTRRRPHPVIATMAEQEAFVEGAGDLGGTMRLGLYPAALKPGTHRRRGLRRRQGRGAPPPPLRGQQRVPRPARGGRPGVQRHVAGLHARRVRRAAARRAPVLRRHPGPPRAAVAPDPAAPAVLRPGRGRPRRASARRGCRSTSRRQRTHERPHPRPARAARRSRRLSATPRTTGRSARRRRVRQRLPERRRRHDRRPRPAASTTACVVQPARRDRRAGARRRRPRAAGRAVPAPGAAPAAGDPRRHARRRGGGRRSTRPCASWPRRPTSPPSDWDRELELFATPGYSSEAWTVFRASGLRPVPHADRTERVAEEADMAQWWLPFDARRRCGARRAHHRRADRRGAARRTGPRSREPR